MLSKLLPKFLASIIGEMYGRRRWQLVGLLVILIVNAIAEFANFGLFFILVRLLSADLGGDQATAMPVGKIEATLMELTPLNLSLLFIAILTVASGIRLFTYWASAQFSYRLSYDFGTRAYSRFLHQNLAWHKNTHSGDIIAILTKAQVLSHALVLPILQGLTAAITAMGAIAFLLSVSLVPTLVLALIYLLSYLAIALLVRPALRRNSMKVKLAHASRVRSGQEAAASIRDVILGGLQGHFTEKYRVYDADYRDGQSNSLVLTGMPRFLLESIGIGSLIALTLYFFQRDDGLANVLPILAALGLGAQRLLPLAQQIYASWATVSANREIASEVLEAARRPAQLSSKRSVASLPFEKSIELENVSFSYSDTLSPVLDNVNLTFDRSSTIGVVGQTGGGKSTLIDIVMGLMTPTQGRMLIDGYALRDSEDIRRWQANISHVPQEIVLIDASIAENIAFGTNRDRIDMAKMADCITMAELDAFVATLPNGAETRVGERGAQLSGGQRQRVGLARAFYSSAPVMVLDEATSALDTTTETKIMHRIAHVSEDMTVFIIAHRLSTLKSCDIIYEIGEGKLTRFETEAYLSRPEASLT
ncbi:Multidrug resistance-associated protein [Alteripontixanthobacter maritimus]|uniref:Multidrug resistance-associated protein n=1 Tax=Alteripontixanthobacter maritimus TaxID=2161824 RepID=A0A369QGI3_9SPHN|nr:ABC transporter ATP-binding protein [Alteripontixanthobacter maritimus]RDC61398.1 Multidrug resistance-associated protein [Alteripontixanthobacter maritimus]